MKDTNCDQRKSTQGRGTVPNPSISNEDMQNLGYIVEAGIEQASKEAIRAALSYWNYRGNDPRDEMIMFLAHMTKDVITGEIAAIDFRDEHPFY